MAKLLVKAIDGEHARRFMRGDVVAVFPDDQQFGRNESLDVWEADVARFHEFDHQRWRAMMKVPEGTDMPARIEELNELIRVAEEKLIALGNLANIERGRVSIAGANIGAPVKHTLNVQMEPGDPFGLVPHYVAESRLIAERERAFRQERDDLRHALMLTQLCERLRGPWPGDFAIVHLEGMTVEDAEQYLAERTKTVSWSRKSKGADGKRERVKDQQIVKRRAWNLDLDSLERRPRGSGRDTLHIRNQITRSWADESVRAAFRKEGK